MSGDDLTGEDPQFPGPSVVEAQVIDGKQAVQERLSEDLTPPDKPGLLGGSSSPSAGWKTIEPPDNAECAVCRSDDNGVKYGLRRSVSETKAGREVALWLSCSEECTEAWIRKYGEIDWPGVQLVVDEQSLEEIRRELFEDRGFQ